MRFSGIVRRIGGKGCEVDGIRTKNGGITPKVRGIPAQIGGIERL
ncbi:hypothetical protein [Bacillus sp. ISL-75]|nr:hypothetical protein [Bacillus sp. ISL-75]